MRSFTVAKINVALSEPMATLALRPNPTFTNTHSTVSRGMSTGWLRLFGCHTKACMSLAAVGRDKEGSPIEDERTHVLVCAYLHSWMWWRASNAAYFCYCMVVIVSNRLSSFRNNYHLRNYASVQYIISDCWPELFSPMILINSPAWTTATYFTVAITSVAIVLLARRTLFVKKTPNLWAKVFPHHGTPSYQHSLLPIRSPPCLIRPMSCPGPAMSIAPIASWDVMSGVQKKVGR